MSKFSRREFLRASAACAIAAPVTLGPGAAGVQEVAWVERKRHARVRGRKMAYYEVGSGDPIVFLHGNPTSSYLWRNVIPHVEHLGRCVAPDMIGMGDSDPLPESGPDTYDFTTNRDYLFELFETIGVDRRAIFVVHDWGSGVGLSWARRNTGSMRGLAFMEPILRPPEFPPNPEPTSGLFATFRSPAGEEAVLENNAFVERILIGGLENYLSEADKKVRIRAAAKAVVGLGLLALGLVFGWVGLRHLLWGEARAAPLAWLFAVPLVGLGWAGIRDVGAVLWRIRADGGGLLDIPVERVWKIAARCYDGRGAVKGRDPDRPDGNVRRERRRLEERTSHVILRDLAPAVPGRGSSVLADTGRAP